MYIIRQDKKILGYADQLTFVRLADNGCYNLCDEADAQGIVYNNTVYQIEGREELNGAETVQIDDVTISSVIKQMNANYDDISEMLVEQEYNITLLQLGVKED